MIEANSIIGSGFMLQGIRVLDFSHYLPGPYASLRLADMGAEVIKIELISGDPARQLGDKKDGNGLIFLANNRNKKSITLNLKNGEGQEIAKKLIQQSDVIIESFRPGVMQRLGLGYEEVKKIKEEIIYCSITGYGQNTELSDFGSHDLNYLALSGLLAQFKDGEGKPTHPTITLADLVGGIAAAEAILGALVQKAIKGQGKFLDIALTDVMISMMTNHVLIAEQKGRKQGLAELDGSKVCYHLYDTKDQRQIALGALEPKFWFNFCHAVGREDWIHYHLSKADESNHVYLEVKEKFLSHTLEEWISFANKVDCCMAPVLEVNELAQSSYVKERGLMDNVLSGYIEVATTYDVERKSLRKGEASPILGKHTDTILQDLLGYSAEKIKELKNKHIV